MLLAYDSQPCRMCLKKSGKAVVAFSLIDDWFTTIMRIVNEPITIDWQTFSDKMRHV